VSSFIATLIYFWKSTSEACRVKKQEVKKNLRRKALGNPRKKDLLAKGGKNKTPPMPLLF
jgi:hypothetical protein